MSAHRAGTPPCGCHASLVWDRKCHQHPEWGLSDHTDTGPEVLRPAPTAAILHPDAAKGESTLSEVATPGDRSTRRHPSGRYVPNWWVQVLSLYTSDAADD